MMSRMRLTEEESEKEDKKDSNRHKKKKFIGKFSDDYRLRTGGRKVDSAYYRRYIASKKIAIIHYLVEQIEQLIIVSSFDFPQAKPGLIDRFIVLAESSGRQPIILFTKRDLVTQEQAQQLLGIYKNTGYSCYVFSKDEEVREKYGLVSVDFLRENIFRGKKSAVVGHSGVGKTTMLNLIDSKYQARTAPISNFTKKGRHATTRVLLYEFSFGGVVYDMPGLKELDYIHLSRDDIKKYYCDFVPHSQHCHYKNCSHDHEKKCGVRDAVLAGKIAPTRYKSYLQIRKTLER